MNDNKIVYDGIIEHVEDLQSISDEFNKIKPYGYIYLWYCNINNKTYVGQTTTLNKRYAQYKCGNPNIKRGIHAAIREHGFDNFDFKILAYANSQEELNRKEIEYVRRYKSMIYENGYNLKEPGGAKGKHSEYSKKIMSEMRKDGGSHWNGKNHKETTKILISIRNKGKIVTEETKKKISLSKMGKGNPNYKLSDSAKLILINKNMDKNSYKFQNILTGELFEGTCYDFYTNFGLDSSMVRKLLNGIAKTHKNWISVNGVVINKPMSKMKNDTKPDKNIYKFIKGDQVFIGTRYDFIDKFNADKTRTAKLIDKDSKVLSVNGWKLNN